MENEKISLEDLELSSSLKNNLNSVGVKTFEQLCELPIDVVLKLCDGELKVVVELLERVERLQTFFV